MIKAEDQHCCGDTRDVSTFKILLKTKYKEARQRNINKISPIVPIGW
jgi:hypothetical protein